MTETLRHGQQRAHKTKRKRYNPALEPVPDDVILSAMVVDARHRIIRRRKPDGKRCDIYPCEAPPVTQILGWNLCAECVQKFEEAKE